jgi:hypothetical protein
MLLSTFMRVPADLAADSVLLGDGSLAEADGSRL